MSTILDSLFVKLAQSKIQRLKTTFQGRKVILDKGNAASAERLSIWIEGLMGTEYADYMEQINDIAMRYGLDLRHTSLENWSEA